MGRQQCNGANEMTKIQIAGFLLILIALAVWQYTRMAEENGRLEQSNADLKQTVKDGEAERDKLKNVAKLNSATLAEVNKEKNILNAYALKKAHELEVLKYENAEINKWAVSIMPHILTGKLFGITDNDDANGLYITADGIINANAGAEIEVQNEDLYNYANDLDEALRSCNADKTGLRGWYQGVGIILH